MVIALLNHEKMHLLEIPHFESRAKMKMSDFSIQELHVKLNGLELIDRIKLNKYLQLNVAFLENSIDLIISPIFHLFGNFLVRDFLSCNCFMSFKTFNISGNC